MTHEIPKALPNLAKYDVVVIGANIGGLFTKHFSRLNHGKNSVFVAFDSSTFWKGLLRPLLEVNMLSVSKLTYSSEKTICKSV